MESPDRDLEVIEEARQLFICRLQGHAPVKVTESQYGYGVNMLSEELRRISAQASCEIRKRYGCPLTYNQASIALLSAMNGLNLIEVVST